MARVSLPNGLGRYVNTGGELSHILNVEVSNARTKGEEQEILRRVHQHIANQSNGCLRVV